MENTLTAIDIAQIAKLIAEDINSRFGQKVDLQPMNHRSRRGEYFSLAIEQNLGVFQMVIQEVHVDVQADHCTDGSIWVKAGLAYTHPGGGTNGSDIGRWWIRDGKIENFSAN